MIKQQSGFTLIELIAVMVILGILAATAIPRFINLSDAAHQATANGVAGGLESASALNHAVDIAQEAGLTTDEPTEIGNCTEVASLLTSALPDGYTIDSAAITNKTSVVCTLNGPTGTGITSQFTAIGACPSTTDAGPGVACS